MEEDWEGCLSIPDLRGLVKRHRAVELEALDRQGKPVRRKIEGLFARAMQHEVDHIEGKVFLDRMESFETLTYATEFQRYFAERD
jgi:peptide deformylase